MKKKLISILLFFLVSLPSYSSEKVVYLDLEKIMQESTAGKSIIGQLKKKSDSSITKFKKREKEIILSSVAGSLMPLGHIQYKGE